MPVSPQKRRQEIYDHLVGNCDCGSEPQFTEADVEVLNKFSLDQLERLMDEKKEEETKEEPVSNEKKEDDKKQEPIVNKQPEPVKFDESMLPDNVKEELQFARNMLQKQKDELIGKITANKNCGFTKEELNKKCPDELTKIVSLISNEEDKDDSKDAKHRTPRLGGHVAPTTNKDKSLQDEILDLPVMNFGSSN